MTGNELNKLIAVFSFTLAAPFAAADLTNIANDLKGIGYDYTETQKRLKKARDENEKEVTIGKYKFISK